MQDEQGKNSRAKQAIINNILLVRTNRGVAQEDLRMCSIGSTAREKKERTKGLCGNRFLYLHGCPNVNCGRCGRSPLETFNVSYLSTGTAGRVLDIHPESSIFSNPLENGRPTTLSPALPMGFSGMHPPAFSRIFVRSGRRTRVRRTRFGAPMRSLGFKPKQMFMWQETAKWVAHTG